MLDPDVVMEYLQNLGATGVRYFPSANRIRSSCPFHGGSNDTALSVNVESGHAYCFSCGYNQKLQVDEVFLPETTVHNFKEKSKEDYSNIAEIVLQEMELSFQSNLRIQDEILLKKCEVGIAQKGPYRGEIIFPYRSMSGQLHGFKHRKTQTKDFGIDNYYNISSVFFLENLWDKVYPPIIVEGEWDAINLHKLGFKNAMALGGTSFTQDRVKKLFPETQNIFLALDNDETGVYKTHKIAEQLSNKFVVKRVLYEAEDPAEIKNPKEFLKALRYAVRLF